MRYRYHRIGLLLGIMLLITVTTPVQAGDINAAEQSVVDYMNQIFTIDGKNYQVSESAKNSAYSKLMQDDTDLTNAQAKAAIRQAGKRVEEGVSNGYLVEVAESSSENTETTETTETEQSTEQDSEQNSEQDSEKPSADTERQDDEPDTSKNPETTEPDDSGDAEDDTPKVPSVKPSGDTTDIQEIIKEAADNDNINIVTNDSGQQLTYTVTDYQKGEIMVAAEDGSVLYKSSFLLKNTGYNMHGAKTAGLLLEMAAIVCVIGAVIYICKWNKGMSNHDE